MPSSSSSFLYIRLEKLQSDNICPFALNPCESDGNIETTLRPDKDKVFSLLLNIQLSCSRIDIYTILF
jgi:hypothetical protein